MEEHPLYGKPKVKHLILDEEKMQDGLQESEHFSPTLRVLKDDHLEKVKTACMDCPASIWHATNSILKCYCKQMYLIVWQEGDDPIKACDGREIAIAMMMEEE